MNLDIIFENREIIVVNKQAGLVVNRSQTIHSETLQDMVCKYLGLPIGDLGVGERAGIVHRLDKETSGIIVVAKSQKSFEALQKQFREREVEKEYITLVHGKINEDLGSVEAKIVRIGKHGKFGISKKREDGRESRTDYKIVSRLQFPLTKIEEMTVADGYNKARIRYLSQHGCEYSLISVFPKTGRTHQIRVHLKHIGHPVVSDLIYGPSKLLKLDLKWCPRLFLHAKKIKFKDPQNNKVIEFNCDLPNDLKNAMLFLTNKQ